MPFAETPDLRIYYEKSGIGPRLLFIGGVCGDLRSDPNVFSSALASRFEILAFDQRGTGRTQKPKQRYTMLDYTNDAVALLEQQSWSDCLVVGVSFGGMVAQELAIRFPDKINAMALACTTAGGAGGSSYPLHELLNMPTESRARLMLGVADTRKNAQWQTENPRETKKLIELATSDTSKFLSEPGGQDGYVRQLRARSEHNTYNRLNMINTPTLVCAGKYDGQAKLESVRNLQEKLRGSELKVFEGGHGFLGQDPKAYSEIIKFLNNNKKSLLG